MQDFKQWLESVPGRKITTNQNLQINYIDPEEDWELASQVEQIATKVQIRPNSNKDVSIIALVGDKVIGGIFSAYYDNEMGRTLDFDVVVDPQWQGYQNAGLRLIDAVISLAQQNECNIIEAFVVNGRLAQVLSNKYGFEGLSNNWNEQAVKMYRAI